MVFFGKSSSKKYKQWGLWAMACTQNHLRTQGERETMDANYQLINLMVEGWNKQCLKAIRKLAEEAEHRRRCTVPQAAWMKWECCKISHKGSAPTEVVWDRGAYQTAPCGRTGAHDGCWWKVWCHIISIFIPYVWSQKRASLIIMATWCSKRDETWGRGV